MPAMSIILDGDNAWPDLKDLPADKFHHSKNIEGVTMLNGGMASGLPSVAFRIKLDDGSVVVAETSARLFCTAARAFMARCPDLFDDQGTVQ